MIKRILSATFSLILSVGTLPSVNAGPPKPDPDAQAASSSSSSSSVSPTSDFQITPWKVEGAVDYDAVLEKFGVEPLTSDLMYRWESLMRRAGKTIGLHPWIKRGIFFSHRHFNDILDAYEKYLDEKERNPEAVCPIFIYTGRGPSSDAMHLGHLIPFMFTKYLQDAFDCNVVIQMSDDEKFYFKDMKFKTVYDLGKKNARDIIAVGFDPKKTFIFSNHDYRLSCREYEELVTEMRKCVTFHTLQKIFGFDDQATPGMIDWPVYQCAAAFYQAYPHLFKRPALCLVAYAIDQDPYFRLSSQISDTMNKRIRSKSVSLPVKHTFSPCSIIGKFIPPLTFNKRDADAGRSTGKMSSSVSAESTIFLTDTPEQIRKKVNKYAFSGSRGDGTLESHRRLGGDVTVDVACQYLNFFETDDEKLHQIYQDFNDGKLTCGETKKLLADRLIEIVSEHQKRLSEITESAVDEFYAQEKGKSE